MSNELKKADFIIIGGGIAGASAGYELSKKGKVIVLEMESQPGYHTTGRSAAIFTKSYRAGDPVLHALVEASEEFLTNPPEDFTDHPLLTLRTLIYLAPRDKQDALDDLHDKLSAINVDVKFLNQGEALRHLPILADDYQSRVLFERDVYDMDVNALHEGFLRGLKKNAGEVITSAEVTGLIRRGDNWSVSTKKGLFQAPVIINAAGAWVDHVAGLADIAPINIKPLRRTMIMVDVPKDYNPEHWPFVMDATEDYYFKPDSGKLIVTPGDEHLSVPTDAQPEDMDIACAAHYLETATTLQVSRIDHSWAGLRNHVADGYPVVGFDQEKPGFFWLAGQGGFGIKTAPAMGRITASLIIEGKLPEDLSKLGITENQISVDRIKSPNLRSHRL